MHDETDKQREIRARALFDPDECKLCFLRYRFSTSSANFLSAASSSQSTDVSYSSRKVFRSFLDHSFSGISSFWGSLLAFSGACDCEGTTTASALDK
jgi:hypothetical protein